MSRIDANLATQINDSTRPTQSARDQENQQQEVRRAEAAKAEPKLLSAANADDVRAATERLQQVIEAATGRKLDFTLNDRFKELVVQVSDRKSGEVIREIPSKEVIRLRERLDDLIGLFIDEKV